MSKLLINEPPLQVLPTLAKEIGLEEAIFVQQLHYWLENPKIGTVSDGYKWVSNTYAEWIEDNFPFWSEDKLRRIVKGLEDNGIIVSAQLDKQSWERKKFYRIEYGKIAASMGANSPVLNRNTETTTEITQLDLQEIETKANQTIDEVLKQEAVNAKKLNYPNREALPEPIRELVDEFVRATGIKPLKRDTMGWLAEVQNWLDFGATVKDVRAAVEYAEGKFSLMDVHSLTKTLRAVKAGAVKQETKTVAPIIPTDGSGFFA